MIGSLKRLLLASGSVGTLLASAPALAQTAAQVTAQSDAVPAAQAAESQDAPTSASQGLQDIIVTAQRVEENSQRAAVAIDVVGGSDLVTSGVNDVGRLDDLVPSLTVTPSGTGNLVFLRGVGNFATTAVSEAAVAFNYDGVYIGRSSNVPSFFDIQRVEVLKGPQGTLYGRNATGGAINVLPVKPRIGELGGYVLGSYGNYNDLRLEGAVNIPVGDNGAIRVSGNVLDRDGYFTDGTNDNEIASLRVQMMGKLTPDLTVRVSGDYTHQGGEGFGTRYAGRYQFGPGGYTFVPSNLPESEGLFTPAAQAFRQTAFIGQAGRAAAPLTVDPKRSNDLFGVLAEIQYDTGFGTLTVIPAWRYTQQDYQYAATGFEFGLDEKDEQFSLEARFNGERIGIFDYVIGGYYYDESLRTRQSVFSSALLSARNQNFYTTALAPFGRLTAHVTDELRLVGGIRYTHEKKRFDQNGFSGSIACRLATPMGPRCPSAPLFPFIENFSVSNTNALPFPFPAPGRPPVAIGGGAVAIRDDQTQRLKLTEGRVTWRAAVEYDILQQSLFYASVETGFRSGGFSGVPGFESFEPETITAYTVGLKNRFLDNRLQLNFEGFYWDYKDQQSNFVGIDVNGAVAQRVGNIGSSTIYGAEVEARYLVTSNTLVSGTVQYLNSNLDSFSYASPIAGPSPSPGAPPTAIPPPVTGCALTPNANPRLINVDCSGFPGYNSPKWTVNLAAQQTIPVAGYQLVLGVDTQYKSERYIAFNFTPENLIGGTWRTNGQVTFRPEGEQWSIGAFVENIENDRVPGFQLVSPVTNLLIEGTSAPRTYGVRASLKF